MWVVKLPLTCPQAVQNWKCCLHAAAALSVQEPLQQLRFPERGLCQRNGTGMDSAAIRLLSLPTHPFVLSPWISVGAQLHRSEAAQTLLNTLPQCCSLAVPSQQNLFLWAKCKPYGIMLLKAWKSDPLNFFFSFMVLIYAHMKVKHVFLFLSLSLSYPKHQKINLFQGGF